MVAIVELLFPVFGLVLLGGGYVLIQKGRFYSRQSERIAETEVSDIGSLRRGTAAIEGTASVHEEAGTVSTALTEEDALVSKSKVTALSDDDDDHGAGGGTRSHETLHEEQRSVPFLVEDGSGTVRVDPPGEADVRLDDNVTVERGRGVPDVGELAEDPEAAASGSVSVGDSHSVLDYDRRYEQGAIVPGEKVYVLGEAIDRAAWDGVDYELGGGENPDRFVVSDLSQTEVATGGKIGAYLTYALGGGLGVFGVLLLLGGLAAVI